MGSACETRKGAPPSLPKVSGTNRLSRHCLTLLEPEKVTCRGTTNRKDVAGPKAVTGQEAAGGSKLGPSGQRRPSRQAAARPAIIKAEESVKEMDGGEEKGKSTL